MANVLTKLGNRLSARYGSGKLRYSPNRNPAPLPRPYSEMGVSGTAVWGGYVQVKERSPEWIGRQKWVTASELAINTAIVGAGVHYFLNLVAYPHWQFKPSDEDDEESQALAEFCDSVVNDMDSSWYKIVRRAAMYRFYGFGIQEWTAKLRDDGLIGLKDVETRPAHTIEQWDIDNNGAVLGVWQRSPQTGELFGIPRDKFMYLVEDTLSDSPEGIGMFRHMASSYNRLKQLQDLEIRAYERDLRGIPIARAPLTMINRAVSEGKLTADQANGMIADMEAMVKLQVKQSDTGLVLDSLPYFSDSDSGDQVSGLPQWGFELLSGAGVGYGEIAAAIERIQREMARVIGVEHLMMGDTGGNRALSEDKSRNLYLIGNSVLKSISSQVKQDILVPLFRLNGFPMKKMPTPETEDITFKNADAITGALQKLASAGAPLNPNDPVINDLRELMGISRVPEDQMAAGAMPSNPAFGGLPPELQAALGGKPGGPPNIGGNPGGSPGSGPGGKPPGLGGGGGTAQKSFSKDAKTLFEEEDQMPKPNLQAQEDVPTARSFSAVLNPGAKNPVIGGKPVIEPHKEEEQTEQKQPNTENPATQAPGGGQAPLQASSMHPQAAAAAQQLQQQAMANNQGQTTQVSTQLLLSVLGHIVGHKQVQQPPQQQGQAGMPPNGNQGDSQGAMPGTNPSPNPPGSPPQGNPAQAGAQAPLGQQGAAAGQQPPPQQGQLGQLPQPGMPPVPPPKEQEMTADRASQVLSPYRAALAHQLAASSEQDGEEDALWDRLGQEKQVQPNLTQPPMPQPGMVVQTGQPMQPQIIPGQPQIAAIPIRHPVEEDSSRKPFPPSKKAIKRVRLSGYGI